MIRNESLNPLDRRTLDLMRTFNALSESQIEEAIRYQNDHPYMQLREIVLGLGMISFSKLEGLIAQATTEMRIGELLLTRRVISKEQLDEALKEQQRRGGLVGEVLIKKGSCTVMQLQAALEEQARFRAVQPYFSNVTAEPPCA